MKKFCVFILLAIMLQACENRNGVVVGLYNHTDTVCMGELVELDYMALLDSLALGHDETVRVLDHADRQVPYLVTSSHKLLFIPEPIESHITTYYRVVPGMPDTFDCDDMREIYDLMCDSAQCASELKALSISLR